MTTNPMMQKNPFMSAWLSAANSSIGAGRGLWMAEVRRQQTAMMTEFNKQVMNFWTGAWMARPATPAAAATLGMPELPRIADMGASVREASGKKAAAPLRATVARRTAGPAKRKTRKAR